MKIFNDRIKEITLKEKRKKKKETHDSKMTFGFYEVNMSKLKFYMSKV